MSSRTRESLDREYPQLSNVECLLLAQAVWEFGSNSWHDVAKLLSTHPLLSRPKTFFTSQSCRTMYIKLIKEEDLPCDHEPTDAVHAPENLKLAQKFYQKRLEELRSLIVAEETKFKTILSEIEAIRNGRWFDQTQPETPKSLPPKGESPKAVAEIFDGSELSGVTDSPTSSDTRDVPMDQTQKSENAEQEDQATVDQPCSADLQPETMETPENMETPSVTDDADIQMDLDVHITTEEYPQLAQPEEESIDVEEQATIAPTGATPSESSPAPASLPESSQVSVDASNVEESKRIHRQEEEEEEEEEPVCPEEEEADQEPEAEAIPASLEPRISPARVDISEDMQRIHNTDNQPPQIEQVDQEDEAAVTSDEPQPVVRRSRRQRSSISTFPPVQRKSTGVRRSRRISEATETDPVSVDGEMEVFPDVDTNAEENDRDRLISPVNDENIPHRIEGKRKASLIESVESPRDKKRPRDDSEPVEDDEPGPSPATIRGRRRGDKTEEQVAHKRFQNVIGMLHAQISQHRNGNIFHNPIKISEAPDYHDIVRRPIDLKTIKGKVKDGLIINSLEYQRDIYLMFANAMMYNVPGSDIYAMAEDMMLESEAHISSFRQTEGLVSRF